MHFHNIYSLPVLNSFLLGPSIDDERVGLLHNFLQYIPQIFNDVNVWNSWWPTYV